MKKYLVNYAAKGTNCAQNHPNAGYVNAQILNSSTGINIAGFDECINYGAHSLSHDFKKMHEKHFSFTRGAGYWIWKPHIILNTFNNINYGDILMYSDSGCHFVHSMNPIFNILESTANKCLCFQLAQIEESWTKRDCFIGMDCDYPSYIKSKQIMSTFFLCKKNEFSIFIVNEWQKYMNDFHMVSDEFVSPSKQANYPDFKEHRHDQSILSLVCKKNKVEIMEDITEWGDINVRGTPQIVAHTRRRD